MMFFTFLCGNTYPLECLFIAAQKKFLSEHLVLFAKACTLMMRILGTKP